MRPQQAFDRVVADRPFDDPDAPHYPTRWYFDEQGVLCKSGWRAAIPTRYPQFRVPPERVRLGAYVKAGAEDPASLTGERSSDDCRGQL